MAQRRVLLQEVGEVIITKRRRMKNVRLSINTTGQIRISLPWWLPYDKGLDFARSQKKWIEQKLTDYRQIILQDGHLIGKGHRLYFLRTTDLKIRSHVSLSEVNIRTSLDPKSEIVQSRARSACEKALKLEAQRLLPQRLEALAIKHNLAYKEVKVRKLTRRWGSCSTNKTITLSYFLIQLPWPLIDYVLLHELLHTKHLHHGKDFWQNLEEIVPETLYLRKLIKTYSPVLRPTVDM